MNITRDMAICMFFYVEYTEQNVQKYKQLIQEKADICYNVRINEPILAPLKRIQEQPEKYHLYADHNTSPTKVLRSFLNI